jgi:FtsZ-interacting cell division protein ZipA
MWYKRGAVSLVAAVSQAQFVGWACFVVGIVLLAAGVGIGLWVSLKQASHKAEDAKKKIDEVKAKLDEARGHIERTKSAAAVSDLEGVAAAAPQATEAVEAAGASTEDAKSALEQVGNIVASLPENLRFAGLLILVGTVLMSVATVQFGGVSLF